MSVIFGWDASRYDNPSIGSAGQGFEGQGFGWITHKAGGDTDDTGIAAWWPGVERRRITVRDLPELTATGTVEGRTVPGARWVLRPGDPVVRADAFLARLDATCPGWRDAPFVLQLDCAIGKTSIAAFCDRLRAEAPRFMPIVQASRGQYGDALTGLGYPLGNTGFPSGAAGSAATLYAKAGEDGWLPYSGQTPAVWHFSEAATVGGRPSCDVSAYRGTLAEFVALVAPGWAPVPSLDASA